MRAMIFLTLFSAAFMFASSSGTSVSAKDALARLTAGNQRFTAGTMKHPNSTAARRSATAHDGQKPYATILTCADSRVPPELIFDAGIGELFILRVAGNVCAVNEAGTIEYGAGHLGTRLVVVMGHSKCGAVTAVVKADAVGGNIAKLVRPIAPAAYRARVERGPCCVDKQVAAAIDYNVWNAIADLFRSSSEIRELAHAGKVSVIGAVYDIESGSVRWLGHHPDERRLTR